MASVSQTISPAIGSNKLVYQATVATEEKALKAEPVKRSLACRVAKVFGATLLIGAAGFIAANAFLREGGSYANNPTFYHWPVEEAYCTAPLKYSDATHNFHGWSEKAVNSSCLDYIKDAITSRNVQEIRADFPNLGNFARTEVYRQHDEVAKVILSKHRALDASDIHQIYLYAKNMDNWELVSLAAQTGEVPPTIVEGDLYFAVRDGEKEKVEALLTDKRLTSHELNRFLVSAIQGGHSSIVEILLADSRVASNLFNSLDGSDISQIYSYARTMDNWELVSLAVQTGKVDRTIIERDLEVGIINKQEKMLEAVLKDKRLTSHTVNELLRMGAKKGYSPVVEVILADSRVTSEGIRNALFFYSLRGQPINKKMVETLLKDKRLTSRELNSCLLDAVRNPRQLSSLVEVILADSRVTSEGIREALAYLYPFSWRNPTIINMLEKDPRYQPGSSYSHSNHHRNSHSVPPDFSIGCTASLPTNLSTDMKQRVQDIYKAYNKADGCDPAKQASNLKVAEALLGVTERDSERAIKKAYRQAALIFHPDKCNKESNKKACTKAFQMISNAQDCLIPA